MIFGEEHAAEDVFFGVLQADFVPEIFGMAAGGIGLADGAKFGVGVLAQAREIASVEAAFDFYVVLLLEIGPVLEHFGGEVAVVSEEQQAAGVVVEAADGID